MREQRLAEPRAARFGAHEQIFEIDAGASLEGREIVEEEREALWRAAQLADQHLGIGARAEKLFAELRLVEADRSEEHTSELQSLMRISYAVFCLKKKKNNNKKHISIESHSRRANQS